MTTLLTGIEIFIFGRNQMRSVLGVSKVLTVMDEYELTKVKDDWDSVIEVGQFERQNDPVASIPSKVCTCRSLILVRENLLIKKLSS